MATRSSRTRVSAQEHKFQCDSENQIVVLFAADTTPTNQMARQVHAHLHCVVATCRATCTRHHASPQPALAQLGLPPQVQPKKAVRVGVFACGNQTSQSRCRRPHCVLPITTFHDELRPELVLEDSVSLSARHHVVRNTYVQNHLADVARLFLRSKTSTQELLCLRPNPTKTLWGRHVYEHHQPQLVRRCKSGHESLSIISAFL